MLLVASAPALKRKLSAQVQFLCGILALFAARLAVAAKKFAQKYVLGPHHRSTWACTTCDRPEDGVASHF